MSDAASCTESIADIPESSPTRDPPNPPLLCLFTSYLRDGHRLTLDPMFASFSQRDKPLPPLRMFRVLVLVL